MRAMFFSLDTDVKLLFRRQVLSILVDRYIDRAGKREPFLMSRVSNW